MRLVYDFQGRDISEKKVGLNKLKVILLSFRNPWAAIALSISNGCLCWLKRKHKLGATWATD
jgi:hypothetical protein